MTGTVVNRGRRVVKIADLRTCASCEWIFSASANNKDGRACPKCGFGSYGAHYCYHSKAYRYAKTQKPWFDKKMSTYAFKLHAEIRAAGGKP